MKRLIFSAIALCAMTVAIAEETTPVQDDKAAKKQKFLERTGGLIEKPGSMRGEFAFINTQTELSSDEIKKVTEVIFDALRIKAVVETAQPGDPATLVKNAKGALGVVIVADDTTPSMLVAPDDGWAVVNVRKLANGLRSDAAKAKFWPSRCRKELIRAFSAVSGGFRSSYPGNVMDVVRISDLDLTAEDIPADKIQSAQEHLKAKGYAPMVVMPYSRACREGWAPAPTNEYQKVIWEQHHSKPTEPMRIKFDPKQGE